MKRNIYLISALTAATIALTTACQQDDLGNTAFTAHPDAVRITATVGNATAATRSNPTGDAEAQKRFNPGDKIGITSLGQPEAVYSLAADAATWTPATPDQFLCWNSETQPQTFHAYYPVGANPTYGTEGLPDGEPLTTDGNNFALPRDQYNDELIAAADYMTTPAAGIARSKADGPVALALERRTARIVVKIARFGNEYTAEEQPYVRNPRILTRTTAIKDGAVQIAPNVLTAIIPHTNNANLVGNGYGIGTTFTALVLPDVARPDDNFIYLQDHTGKDLIAKGIPTVEAGKSYEYTLTVGKERLTLSNVIVKDWGTGVTLPDGNATPAPFGDPAFVAALKDLGVPTDAAGRIDPTDAATLAKLEAIKELIIYQKGIRSLRGIEYLTGLEFLGCNDNQLTALDVSKNTKLTNLSCAINAITTLDVSKNKELSVLDITNNRLTTLDVSENTELTQLGCGGNRLTTLDVSKNTNLTLLTCNSNHLTALDITPITATLTYFIFGYQKDENDAETRTITVRATRAQYIAYKDYDEIGERVTFDAPFADQAFVDALLAAHSDLKDPNGGFNPDDPTTKTELERISRLDLLGKGIKNLRGIEYMTNLKNLICNMNPGIALDVSKNTELTGLSCSFNLLTTLDVSQNTKLTQLSCNDNRLTTLDVSKNTKLNSLYCNSNCLTALDITPITTTLTVFQCGWQMDENDVENRTITVKLTAAQKITIEGSSIPLGDNVVLQVP